MQTRLCGTSQRRRLEWLTLNCWRSEIGHAPFYRPPEDSVEAGYMRDRRQALGGYVPARRNRAEPLTSVGRLVDQHYGDERLLGLALADALNKEAKALADAGADIVQVDEPSFQATNPAIDRAPVAPHNPSRSTSATISTMRPSIALR